MIRKRLVIILSIIFIPVLFSSLCNAVILHGIWCFRVPKDVLSEGYSIHETAMFIYRACMGAAWWLMIMSALLIDVYFYMLKGYKYGELGFYAIKIALAFIIMFFLTNTLFQSDFIAAFNAYQPIPISYGTYASLFIISILACVPSVYVIHEIHTRWVLPEYIRSMRAKN